MPVSKVKLLEETINITKEYARGGGAIALPTVLDEVFKKLEELNEKTRE